MTRQEQALSWVVQLMDQSAGALPATPVLVPLQLGTIWHLRSSVPMPQRRCSDGLDFSLQGYHGARCRSGVDFRLDVRALRRRAGQWLAL